MKSSSSFAAVGAALALQLAGCATVINEPTQPVRVDTRTADGQTVAGAACTLRTEHGAMSMKSGESVPVRRSGQDLEISCRHAGLPEAQARVISRVNGGFAGNLILGGGIGAYVDHKKGTAYTYPSWVQLIFGRTMVFDRSAERDGLPVPGVEVGSVQAAR